MSSIDYINRLDGVSKIVYDAVLNNTTLPDDSKLVLSDSYIEAQYDFLFRYRLMLKSTSAIMNAVSLNEEAHSKDVQTSLMYPANPAVHKVVKYNAFLKAIQDVFMLLLDSKNNPDKYTDVEHDLIKCKVELIGTTVDNMYVKLMTTHAEKIAAATEEE